MLQFFRKSTATIKKALTKTRSILTQRLNALLGRPFDEATLEELEALLFEADLGATSITSFLDTIRKKLRFQTTHTTEEILLLLKEEVLSVLTKEPLKPLSSHHPLVILIVGVNGSGKTTSIAKLAAYFKAKHRKVLLAAGDTFRAAATEQLQLFAEKLEIELVKGQIGSDPSAVVFDALSAAQSRNIDVVLIDTAGRLHNKTDLMHELKKMRSVCHKVIPNAPHETWLVLDATTGQNALDQAKTFHTFTPLSGIILTKLDGSAKGGMIVPIYQQEKIPVVFVGTGEAVEDLEPFDPKSYVEGLFG